MKYSKTYFYLSYLYYKLRIPLDVKKGWVEVMAAEIIWFINNLFKKKFKLSGIFERGYFETINGKFYVTPDIISIITLSPAFERLDSDELINLVQKKINESKSILIVDIGAYFGDYTVKLGNRFKKDKKVKIYAFEPGTEYLSSQTLDQLKKNIKVNRLTNVKIFNFGIGSKKEKNKLGISVRPLHLAVNKNDYFKYDVVFVKLDIDDYVIDGLFGIQKAVENFKEVYLLVEDFVKPKETLYFLEKHNYKFITKLTPYNSFWVKHNE